MSVTSTCTIRPITAHMRPDLGGAAAGGAATAEAGAKGDAADESRRASASDDEQQQPAQKQAPAELERMLNSRFRWRPSGPDVFNRRAGAGSMLYRSRMGVDPYTSRPNRQRQRPKTASGAYTRGARGGGGGGGSRGNSKHGSAASSTSAASSRAPSEDAATTRARDGTGAPASSSELAGGAVEAFGGALRRGSGAALADGGSEGQKRRQHQQAGAGPYALRHETFVDPETVMRRKCALALCSLAERPDERGRIMDDHAAQVLCKLSHCADALTQLTCARALFLLASDVPASQTEAPAFERARQLRRGLPELAHSRTRRDMVACGVVPELKALVHGIKQGPGGTSAGAESGGGAVPAEVARLRPGMRGLLSKAARRAVAARAEVTPRVHESNLHLGH